jgi:hypothetical protein
VKREKKERNRRIAFILASVLVVAIAGAIACALRDPFEPVPGRAGTGPGTGSASTGTGSVSADDATGLTETGAGTGFVVATSAAVGDPLTPGGPAQTVAFTVTNPGSAGQILTDVSVTITDTGGGVWTAGGCSAADFTVGVPAVGYGEIAPSGVVAGTVTVGMNNLTLNQDACKNVVVPLRFVALRG